MTDVQHLVQELTVAYEGDEQGDGRFAPALRPLLRGVSAEQALKKPISNAHNIGEIVLHLTAWKNYVANWLEEMYENMEGERDWPRIVRADDDGWLAAMEELHASQMRLINNATKIEARELHFVPAGRKSTRAQVLHGMIQHDCYHGGQIAMIKKSWA